MTENLLSKFVLDGTEMTIADTKARTDASDAKETALKKALITYDSTIHTMTITQGGE